MHEGITNFISPLPFRGLLCLCTIALGVCVKIPAMHAYNYYLYISLLYHLLSLYTAAPVIDTPSSSTVTVTIGSSLALSCTSRGSPPDTFTWRKDNDPTVLQSTSITAVDYTSTSAVFRADYSIDSVTTSDSGTYTCTVTNPIGSDSTTITVVSKSTVIIK